MRDYSTGLPTEDQDNEWKLIEDEKLVYHSTEQGLG
jgi:hypothetical protein